MTIHVAGTKPKDPKIIINENANPKMLALLFFGIPAVIMLLALPFPFFRGVFIFGSIIVAILSVLVTTAAMDDVKNGCKRPRPKKADFKLPKWFQPVYFLTIISLSAGLRLGYFLVPLAWVAIWICFTLTMQAVKKTWEEEEPNGRD